MKRAVCYMLLLLLLTLPAAGLTQAFVYTLTTDATVTDVMLMGDDNQIISEVADKQESGNQTIWTLYITLTDDFSGYFYTKDASGNWIRGNALDIAPAPSGASNGAAASPDAAGSAAPALAEKPWEEITYSRIGITFRPKAESERVQSRCGPANTYHGAGAYKTYKVTSAEALFIEGSYVLVDLDYLTVGKRVIYFPTNAFYNMNGVPKVTLTSAGAYTTAGLIPQFGPGFEYDTFDEAQIEAGTDLQVFFEEDGWVFAEFNCALGMVRAWIPVESVGY